MMTKHIRRCSVRHMSLVFAAAQRKKFTIPDGVKKITSYAFSSAASLAIHIPASVAKIEKEAFNMRPLRENIKIKDVTISENNRVFARDGQCIYRKSDKSLAIAIPDEKGELRISEQVEKLTPDISLINCDTCEVAWIEKVIYPSNLKYVIAPGLDVIDARNVYFTGSVPPKVADSEEYLYARLPSCHIYVPKAYEKVYKKWYKENGYDSSHLDGWHTYDPENGF